MSANIDPSAEAPPEPVGGDDAVVPRLSAASHVFRIWELVLRIVTMCGVQLDDADVEGYERVVGYRGNFVIALMRTCRMMREVLKGMLTTREGRTRFVVQLHFSSADFQRRDVPIAGNDFLRQSIVYMTLHFADMFHARSMFAQFWQNRRSNEFFQNLCLEGLSILGERFEEDDTNTFVEPCACLSVMHGVELRQMRQFFRFVQRNLLFLQIHGVMLGCACRDRARCYVLPDEMTVTLRRLDVSLVGPFPCHQLQLSFLRVRELLCDEFGRDEGGFPETRLTDPDLRSVVLRRPRAVPVFGPNVRELTFIDGDWPLLDSRRWFEVIRYLNNRAINAGLAAEIRINCIACPQDVVPCIARVFMQFATTVHQFMISFNAVAYADEDTARADGAMQTLADVPDNGAGGAAAP